MDTSRQRDQLVQTTCPVRCVRSGYTICNDLSPLVAHDSNGSQYKKKKKEKKEEASESP